MVAYFLGLFPAAWNMEGNRNPDLGSASHQNPMTPNPEYDKAPISLEFPEVIKVHVGPSPDNPSFASSKPHCKECDGAHEPSGARSDCIRYWKHLAFQSIQSVEWARTLLCSATPGKVLDEKQSVEWCQGFGKWFAESHSLPVLMDDAGCAKQVCDWLQAGKYRIIMHRHTGTFRAVNELADMMINADTIPLLADALMNFESEATPYDERPI